MIKSFHELALFYFAFRIDKIKAGAIFKGSHLKLLSVKSMDNQS
jgi:hypothetical protein